MAGMWQTQPDQKRLGQLPASRRWPIEERARWLRGRRTAMKVLLSISSPFSHFLHPDEQKIWRNCERDHMWIEQRLDRQEAQAEIEIGSDELIGRAVEPNVSDLISVLTSMEKTMRTKNPRRFVPYDQWLAVFLYQSQYRGKFDFVPFQPP
jgi:hypothetical protein